MPTAASPAVRRRIVPASRPSEPRATAARSRLPSITLVAIGQRCSLEEASASRALLSEDEELIYDLRPHWLTLVVPVLITVAVMVRWRRPGWSCPPATQQPARMVVGVLGLVVLLATVVGRVLRWSTTHFVLTERLIFRSGRGCSAARSCWSGSTTSPSPSRCSNG